MFSLNNKISIRQLQALLLLDVFGTGVIVLPRIAAEYANQDGWVIIVVATMIAALYGYAITSIGRMFPNESFVSYCSKILTKPIGILISLGFVFKIIIMIAMELRSFGEIIKLTMLYETPFAVVCISMLLVGGYAAAKGYETRARMAEILVVLAFAPLIFVFLIGMVDIDFSNLRPTLVAEPQNILMGGFVSSRAFTCIEFCLLIYPFMQNPKNVRRGVTQIIFIIGGFMLFITAITIAKFGPFDVVRQMWPVLEMMDVIDLPGSFIERQDAFIMSFWIISVFAIVNAGLFFSSIILKDVIHKGKHSTYILISILAAYGISFIPNNISEVYQVMDFMFITFGVAYMFVIPLVLLVVAKLRGWGEKL